MPDQVNQPERSPMTVVHIILPSLATPEARATATRIRIEIPTDDLDVDVIPILCEAITMLARQRHELTRP